MARWGKILSAPVEANYSHVYCSIVDLRPLFDRWSEPRNISPLRQSTIRPLWHSIARSLSPNICPLMLIRMLRLMQNICLLRKHIVRSHVEAKCFSFFEAIHALTKNHLTVEAKHYSAVSPSYWAEPYFIAWIAVTLKASSNKIVKLSQTVADCRRLSQTIGDGSATDRESIVSVSCVNGHTFRKYTCILIFHMTRLPQLFLGEIFNSPWQQ